MKPFMNLLFLCVAMVALNAPAPGDPLPPLSTARQNAPTTVPYINYAFGFEIQTPAGWNYDRTGFFGPGGSVGVLLGASPDGQASVQILVFKEVNAKSFPDWIEFFSKQLAGINGVQRVSVEGMQAGVRSACYVVADAKLGADLTRSVYHCVELDLRTILVVMYAMVTGRDYDGSAAPAPSSAEIPEALRRLVGTLRVFHDPKVAQELDEALERGRQWISRYQLEPAARKLRVDGRMRHYLMERAGKPIGYLSRRVYAHAQSVGDPRYKGGAEGLRVEDETWRFSDDAVEFVRHELFSSLDGSSDVFDLWSAVIPSSPAPVFSRHDQCVRGDDVLFSSVRTNRDEALPAPREPLRLGSGYLGLAWARVLPALCGTEAGPLIAFNIYDAETRTLAQLAVQPLGEAKLPDGAQAFKYLSREGFAEKPTFVFTDEYGNLLRMEAGDLTLRLTDARTVDQLFGVRRDAARSRASQSP